MKYIYYSNIFREETKDSTDNSDSSSESDSDQESKPKIKSSVTAAPSSKVRERTDNDIIFYETLNVDYKTGNVVINLPTSCILQ